MLKFKYVHQSMLVLILTWVIAFYLQERFLVNLAISKCHWPGVKTTDDNDDSQNTNVLLIADPQLIDNHTYPGRNELLLTLSKHTVDTYIKKNYNVLLDKLKPDYIFFLGDLLDNGRDSTDLYFNNELNRFNRIFNPNKQMYFNVPGNHDIGFGNGVKVPIRNRFESTFGKCNEVTEINGVEFIALDTPSISSTDDVVSETSKKFLNDLPLKTKPRILLTHVPLYRDPSMSCGPLRESAYFDVNGRGYQYKNSVDAELSKTILAKIKPDITFTGDDHDYCDIVHDGGYREITVKSISMAMGKKYPAVQLLSFTNKESFKYDTEICFLRTPYINVVNYVILAVLSGIFIFWWNLKTKSTRFTYTSILPLHDVINIPVEQNSRKIQKFIREQDNEDYMEIKDNLSPLTSSTSSNTYSLPSSIPQYTFTQSNNNHGLMSKFNNTRLGKVYILNKRRIFNFLKRYNLISFIKQCGTMGSIVIFIYYVGFVITLY
ncbi:CDC1 Cell division control protein 1 [Candida maltosa Xu316]|uniref:Putative Mn2+ homeostasis protein n=1 Tax=Candida maltosa (strain Xu316) TaxID=1245528 RepID=M3JZQ2_CANMX|nr:putative Mn2+ homeostasis protein [Candida maltosa Xu316]